MVLKILVFSITILSKKKGNSVGKLTIEVCYLKLYTIIKVHKFEFGMENIISVIQVDCDLRLNFNNLTTISCREQVVSSCVIFQV